MIGIALKYSARIDKSVFWPHVNWRNTTNNRNGNGRVRTPAGASLITSGV
jgi:hypothetical protein